jgi:hypothetical protein
MKRKALPPKIQIDDDEWVEVAWRKQLEECCDCGLVHEVDHRVVKGKLQFRARRIEQ